MVQRLQLPARLLDDDLRRVLRGLAPYRRRLAGVLALSLISTLSAVYLPYLSRELIDRALVGRDAAALVRVVALFVAITLAGFALNVASGMRYTRLSAEILFDMRLDLYRHLQRLSPRFYARTRLGDIVSRINNDVAEIQRIAAETALAWVGNVLFLAGTIAMLVWLDPRLSLLTAAFLPPSLWTLVRYRRRLAGRVAELRQSSADIGSFLIETLQGMKLVVLSNAAEREVARFRSRNQRFIRALLEMQLLGYLSAGLPGVILSGSTVAIFLYGGGKVIAGTMTMGTFVAFMAYQMRLLPPIQALLGLYSNLATVKVSLGRVHALLDTPPEVVEGVGATPLETARGELAFESVTLRHEGRDPILDRVSFRVRPGEVLAVVGPSGSGKSTLADLALRLLDPDSGVVRLDGHDLRSLRLADLRRHVALVEQEPFVFHDTIAENLRYARPQATESELAAAARAAGIEEFIEALPERYGTVVGERGRALSAGERQRVAIARAYLADPTVLILDEPTAALDPISERQVVAGYEALMKGRTTIVISHRRELARQADRIVVLEGARIADEGSPDELVERRGAFSALFGSS
jgi:ATP-binding cassette subfamily B protein